MKEMLGWDDCRGCLKRVTNKCMKIDPLQRYQNISEVKRAVKFSPKRGVITAFIAAAVIFAAALVSFLIVRSGIRIEVKLDTPDTETMTQEETQNTTQSTTEATTEMTTETTTAETTELTAEETTLAKPQRADNTQAEGNNNTQNRGNTGSSNKTDLLNRRGENYILNGIDLKTLYCIEMEPNREHSIQLIVDDDAHYDVIDYTIDENNMLWVKVLTGNLLMSDGWVCVDDPINIRY